MTTKTAASGEAIKWNALIENRNEKANYYFQTVLDHQIDWYSTKADLQKKRHYIFAISVIALGALISFLQVLDAAEWIKYLTAALGAAISLIRALDSFLRPGETWQTYRKASENMKREQRLFINNADDYRKAANEEDAYRLFVERVEMVLAEEQQLYWQAHAKTTVQETTEQADNEE